jgi:ribosomal protein S18 acetylase RimI-like enzyme
VAALRGDVVREGLLARLGDGARSAYFRVAAEDPETFGFVTSDDAGIAGFVLVTAAPRRLERRTIMGNPGIWLRLVAVASRSPGLAAAGLRRFLAAGRPTVREGRDADPRLRLLDIAVARRAQGRGHGRLLLAAALEEAWHRGFDAIGLSVLDDNADAVRLYERAGFRRTGGGVREDGRAYLVMRLDRPAVPSATDPSLGPTGGSAPSPHVGRLAG